MMRSESGVTLEHAQRMVTQGMVRLGAETVPVSQARGRVLRRDVVADSDFPTTDISRVDGYCLNASATSSATETSPVLLKIKATVRAGTAPTFSLARDQCARVMTGGMLPQGSDAVVKGEDILVGDDEIRVFGAVPAGQYVSRAGETAKAGYRVLESGWTITALMIGLIAGLAGRAVSVSKKPRVGILATGDEVVAPDEPVGPGCKRNSNAYMLRAFLEGLRCDVVDAGISGDTVADLIRHIQMCGHCDAIITTGGVSVSEHDRVPHCLRDLGAEIGFRYLDMVPGRRVVFAREGSRVFFCLPGSPVASLVLFHMLVKPGLLASMGHRNPVPSPVRARMKSPVQGIVERMTFIPARLLPDLRVEPIASRGSADLVRLAAANALIALAQGAGGVESGELVDVYPLGLDE